MKFSTVVLINESASIFVFCFVSILLIELHLVDITVAVNGCWCAYVLFRNFSLFSLVDDVFIYPSVIQY